uniref:Uncharacterized protein n=1 Tax=Ixodes ricinus TaxID=34613 RepID=A0A6B0UZL2_IXORI
MPSSRPWLGCCTSPSAAWSSKSAASGKCFPCAASPAAPNGPSSSWSSAASSSLAGLTYSWFSSSACRPPCQAAPFLWPPHKRFSSWRLAGALPFLTWAASPFTGFGGTSTSGAAPSTGTESPPAATWWSPASPWAALATGGRTCISLLPSAFPAAASCFLGAAMASSCPSPFSFSGAWSGGCS